MKTVAQLYADAFWRSTARTLDAGSYTPVAGRSPSDLLRDALWIYTPRTLLTTPIAGLTLTPSTGDLHGSFTAVTNGVACRYSVDGGSNWTGGDTATTFTIAGGAQREVAVTLQALDADGDILAATTFVRVASDAGMMMVMV